MKWIVVICSALVGVAAGVWSRDWTSNPGRPPIAPESPPAQRVAARMDPLAEIVTALRRKPDLQQFAALSEPLSRLSAPQMGELLDRVERDSREHTDYRAGWLFKWWIERDPEGASAWALPRLKLLGQDGTGGFDHGNDSAIIQAWGKKFPDQALELARTYPRSNLAASLLYYAVEKDRANPPGGGWPLLRDFPEGPAKAREAARFLEAWAKKDAAAAFTAAQSLGPGKTRDRAMEKVLPALAAKDPAAAFEQYNQLGFSDPELVTKMIAGAGSKDPAGIAAWLMQLEPTLFAQAAPTLVDKWAALDPAAALNWARSHQVALQWRSDDTYEVTHAGFQRSTSFSIGRVGANPLTTAMTKQPDATMAWLQTLPAGPERDGMAERLVSGAKIEHALKLYAELSPAARERAALDIMQKLAKEPKRAAEWAGSLPAGDARESAWRSLGQNVGATFEPPPGPDRDAWLHGRVFGGGGVNSGPQDSLQLVLEIGNVAKRQKVFDAAMEHYTHELYTPQRALDWMEKADLPEAWKAKWRRKK